MLALFILVASGFVLVVLVIAALALLSRHEWVRDLARKDAIQDAVKGVGPASRANPAIDPREPFEMRVYVREYSKAYTEFVNGASRHHE